MRVLIVEDDDAIADPLAKGLEREGFDVDRVETGADALDRSATGDFDVVLLDLGLPDRDGFDVCRELRARSDVPIIVVTARGDEVDRVVGLELGADDYIVKPFGFRELVARIRAVARRAARPATTPSPARHGTAEHGSVVEVGTLTVDRRTRRVTVDGDEVALTPKEFDLLAFLAEDAGAVCTRQQHPRERLGPALVRARRRRSTCTSRRCARSSATRAGSRRCAASGSGSRPRRADGGAVKRRLLLSYLSHHRRSSSSCWRSRSACRTPTRSSAGSRAICSTTRSRSPSGRRSRSTGPTPAPASRRRAPSRRSPTGTTRTRVDAS